MKSLFRANKAKIVLLTLIFITIISSIGHAKSAYLGSNHHVRQFDAWNINPDGSVTYQGTYPFAHATDPSGLAIDADVGPGENPVIFSTSEFSRGIEIVDPITLTYMGLSTCPDTTSKCPRNLAGVDVDDKENIVFSLGRASNDLYIFNWDPIAQTLILVKKIDLPGMRSGYGISLDDAANILWVTDTRNKMVRAYDVNVPIWDDIEELPNLSFPVSHSPVDVSVDSKRQLVYTVAGWTGSTLFTKFDLATATETTFDLGAGGIGLAVDEATGYVYITRGLRSNSDDIQVYDTSTSPWRLIHDTPRVGNPAGICIPQDEVSYNPLNLTKDDGLTDDCAGPGATVTYNICYDNVNNNFPVSDVTIIDNLPAEVSWLSGGNYDAGSRSVSWDIGTLPANGAGECVQLQVSVGAATLPGTSVTNKVTIKSNETGPTTISIATVICQGGSPCCDLNNDNDCDEDDYTLFLGAYGRREGDSGWLEKADYDKDGLVTLPDFHRWYSCYWDYSSLN